MRSAFATVLSRCAMTSVVRPRMSPARALCTACSFAESRLEVAHPANPRVHGLDGVVFTGPASEARADLRTMLVLANGATDRSPSGTGTAAVLAVLTAMGILEEGATLVTEGLIGTHCRARVAARTRVEDYDAIVPEIVVSAWITGEHTFLIDGEDPLKAGFRL